VIEQIEAELLQAERVLDTEYSFELAEPHYRNCLALIASAPSRQEEMENLMIRMYSERTISDEPVAYLMHVLKWPKVRSWVERKLAEDTAAIATGAAHENILMAYSEEWKNKEFYKFG